MNQITIKKLMLHTHTRLLWAVHVFSFRLSFELSSFYHWSVRSYFVVIRLLIILP